MNKICWNLTNVCNEECVFCFRELFESPRTLDDNLIIMDNLYSLGIRKITFAGGEPLRYPDLDILMSHARSLGIGYSLVTNGSLLNKDNIDQYLNGLEKLTFSIDSSVGFQNKLIGRGEKHYDHIKEILPIIREKYPNLIIEINTVVFKENIKQLDILYEDILSDFAQYNIHKWKLSRFCPIRGKAKTNESLYSVSDEEFQEIKDAYSGEDAFFEISARDTDDVNRNIIVSPGGKLKISRNNKEFTIFDDLSDIKSYDLDMDYEGGSFHV